MTKGIAIKPSRVRVSTKLYVSEVGEMPHGKGYWVFQETGKRLITWEIDARYSEAKRCAKRRAAANGFYDIEVVP